MCRTPVERKQCRRYLQSLSRIGHLIEVVDENYYINLSNTTLLNKVIDKMTRSLGINEFNKAILKSAASFTPDIILVYKGAFVLPETLQELKKKKIPLVNFFPDVSFRAHGKLLAQSLPLYDFVFTTKTFGIEDMKEQLGITNSHFIPHGFDPEIHRPIDIRQIDTTLFNCDISFIGGYSKKKESYLLRVKKEFPTLSIKIWGGRWENCSEKSLQPSIMHKSILGDLYVLGILSSKINLGLLHEKVQGASSGDKITSRTFHIPAAGGFMMHEKTEEVINYFEEDKEVVFFANEEELCAKIHRYIQDTELKEKIRIAGQKRAWKDHSLDNRASECIHILKTRLKI